MKSNVRPPVTTGVTNHQQAHAVQQPSFVAMLMDGTRSVAPACTASMRYPEAKNACAAPMKSNVRPPVTTGVTNHQQAHAVQQPSFVAMLMDGARSVAPACTAS